MSVWRLAWRNVWRNTRRSVVTIAATTFALWVMVLYSGMMEGYTSGMARDILDFEVGEVQVYPEGYLDDPSVYRRLPSASVTALEQAGYRVSARLMAGALGASGQQSSGIVLRGVDPTRETTALRIDERVASGRWLDAADPHGVVIGRRVARTLGVGLGGEIVVLTQGTDGSLANDLFVVRGILGPIADGTDRGAVFVPLDTLRELLVVPEGVHQLVVRLPPGAPLDPAPIAALVPGADVRTWRALMPTVATMLDATKSVLFLVIFLVYIAVGILVLNAMLMAVFERIREFGVMKALGTGPWLVFRVILAESLVQIGLSLALGLGLALPFAVYLTRYGLDVSSLAGTSVVGLSLPSVWYAEFDATSVGTPVTVLVMVVSAAVLWPAIKAARLRPLDAMRYR